jgi:hypothetical protein
MLNETTGGPSNKFYLCLKLPYHQLLGSSRDIFSWDSCPKCLENSDCKSVILIQTFLFRLKDTGTKNIQNVYLGEPGVDLEASKTYIKRTLCEVADWNGTSQLASCEQGKTSIAFRIDQRLLINSNHSIRYLYISHSRTSI